MSILTMDKILESNPALREQMSAMDTTIHCMMEINRAVQQSHEAADYFLDNYRLVLCSANQSTKRRRKK